MKTRKEAIEEGFNEFFNGPPKSSSEFFFEKGSAWQKEQDAAENTKLRAEIEKMKTELQAYKKLIKEIGEVRVCRKCFDAVDKVCREFKL